MAWFTRKKGASAEEPAAPESSPGRGLASPAGGGAHALSALETDESLLDESGLGPLRPRERGLGDRERARIADALAALADAGVAVDDIGSVGSAYDRAYAEWAAARRRGDHDTIVERFAIGIGEHLARHTDLRWRIVTDVFGTDLALADDRDGDFVVVPGNLVAARWMRGETGWIPGVVGHLVRLRG
jgi:hypothetical protein